jgi:hypothetical protein
MVGHENSIKTIALLVLYFGLMGLIITLVSNISGTTISTTSDMDDYIGYRCEIPRSIYEPFNPQPLTADELDSMSSYEKNNKARSLSCDLTKGVLDETECNSIDGCTWETSGWWFWETDESCNGNVDYGINSTPLFGYGEQAYADGERVFVCDYPDVKYNETLCDIFSCTWKYVDGAEIQLETQQSRGMFQSTMNTIGGMMSLRFDYGFDNATARILLNLILFWLPFIILIVALYQLIPLI